jgi:hypothetical protein
MSEQHGRKRDPWKLPGEGTGVYGVDPMVYLNPGDNAEVDKLLEELRTECDEGDPFFVDFRKRRRKLKALASSRGGEGGATEARGKSTKRTGGVSPRWLGYATVAIVGPVVMLLLVMLLSSHKPAAGEAARVAEISQAAPAPPMASPSVATAAPAASPLTSSAAVPSADVAPAPASTGRPTASGPRVSPAQSRAAKEEEDPYAMAPVAAPSALPSAGPEDTPEKQAPAGASGFEKPEAEF